MKMGQIAKKLQTEGKSVLNFSLGEPDFKTPGHICEAAKRALDFGYTHYTGSAGVDELRETIAEKIRGENKVDVSAENVIVTPGAKQAIYELMMSVLDDGDEVILLDPAWVTFESAVKLAGGNPKWVKRVEEEINYASLESAVSENTKLIVINSPNNPAGYVLSDNELKEIAEFAIDHDLLVLSDEIYEKIIYGRKHVSIASFDGMQARTVIINGFSKTYAMTGWRIGYAVAPTTEILEGMLKIQQHSVTCAPAIAQSAALTALNSPQDCVNEMVEQFKRRRDAIVKRLNEIGLRCLNPEGAVYAFVSTSNYGNDIEFTERLLKEAYIVVTPGSAFGVAGKNYVRFSFAASIEDILEG
ncbi:Aromatic-amino-acid aminotransferase 2, partial [ANME-1 cluster archaeon GoMg1]|nr:Aromatic-amino-acid aminotransferase 2 [ANME-1 cluster archaeon GoMg1]NQE04265.1 Aromatic-amino-acid aminotransferase 2 [ANME-1 cluster archaeon GoMg1]